MDATGGTVSMTSEMASSVLLASPTLDIKWERLPWQRSRLWPLLMMEYLWWKARLTPTLITMSTCELVCASVRLAVITGLVCTSQTILESLMSIWLFVFLSIIITFISKHYLLVYIIIFFCRGPSTQLLVPWPHPAWCGAGCGSVCGGSQDSGSGTDGWCQQW